MKAFRPGISKVFTGESRLKPQLVIVSAPSGAGKSTLCARLVKDYPEIIENVSFTTRPPRHGEEDGVEYFFIEKWEFEEKIERGFFIEYAKVHDHYYGVSETQIETAINAGRPIILDIDVQGASTLKKKFFEALTIFVMPPSIEVLEKRLIDRDKGKTNNLKLRLENAAREIQRAHEFKFQIINDDLDASYQAFKKIVESELGNG